MSVSVTVSQQPPSAVVVSVPGPQGATGATGSQGVQGPVGPPINVIGVLAAPANLPVSGDVGDAYLMADGDLWVWDGSAWVDRGKVWGNTVSAPFGGVYFTTDAPTTIVTQGVFVKAAGTTAYSSAMRYEIDDNGVSNRLRYTGDRDVHFHIVAQSSINFVAGTNQVAAIQVWKFDASAGTGMLLAHSLAEAVAPVQNVMQITTHADMMLSTGDYLELHIANTSGTNNITVQEGYLFCVGMIPQGPQGVKGDAGITVSATAPANPSVDDLWLDVS